MGRNKGICTLCGKGKRLTFEHVPPQAAANLRNMVSYTMFEWLEHVEAGRPLGRGRPQPEGTGSIALCEECNRFLGESYVPQFAKFVVAGREILGDLAERLETFDTRLTPPIGTMTFFGIHRLAVAKQIVAMLLVIAGRGPVEANPELTQFVRDPTVRLTNDRYRLFLGVCPGPYARFSGVTGGYNLESGEIRCFTELAYPPYAYALDLNGAAIYPAGEITGWMRATPGTADETIQLPLAFAHTAFPGDIRSRAQVAADIKRNREAGEHGEHP